MLAHGIAKTKVDLSSFTVIFISAVSNSMGRKVNQIAQILQVKLSQEVEFMGKGSPGLVLVRGI